MPRLRISEWLRGAARGIVGGAAILSYICVVGILLVVISNVFLRYVLGSPFYGGDEVSINLMIIMVYFASGIVLAEGRHIRVSVVFNRLPRKAQNVLWVVVSLFGAGYAGFLSYAVILLTIDTLQLGTYSVTTDWPIAPWQMVIVAGLLSLTVSFITLVVVRVGIISGIKKEKKVEEGKAVLWD